METGQYGNCDKCGSKLDMHYVIWCPSCEIPEPKSRQVFDFFKTARYIARQEGYENRDYKGQAWEHKVMDWLNFPCNDSFITITPSHERAEENYAAEELCEYCEGLLNHFNVGEEETVILEISW